MTDPVDLLPEILRAIQADGDETRAAVRLLTTRVSSLEGHVAQLHTDMAGMNLRMDGLNSRLQCVETRLRDSESGASAGQRAGGPCHNPKV